MKDKRQSSPFVPLYKKSGAAAFRQVHLGQKFDSVIIIVYEGYNYVAYP